MSLAALTLGLVFAAIGLFQFRHARAAGDVEAGAKARVAGLLCGVVAIGFFLAAAVSMLRPAS